MKAKRYCTENEENMEMCGNFNISFTSDKRTVVFKKRIIADRKCLGTMHLTESAHSGTTLHVVACCRRYGLFAVKRLFRLVDDGTRSERKRSVKFRKSATKHAKRPGSA